MLQRPIFKLFVPALIVNRTVVSYVQRLKKSLVTVLRLLVFRNRGESIRNQRNGDESWEEHSNAKARRKNQWGCVKINAKNPKLVTETIRGWEQTMCVKDAPRKMWNKGKSWKREEKKYVLFDRRKREKKWWGGIYFLTAIYLANRNFKIACLFLVFFFSWFHRIFWVFLALLKQSPAH